MKKIDLKPTLHSHTHRSPAPANAKNQRQAISMSIPTHLYPGRKKKAQQVTMADTAYRTLL